MLTSERLGAVPKELPRADGGGTQAPEVLPPNRQTRYQVSEALPPVTSTIDRTGQLPHRLPEDQQPKDAR